jgi:hypothetical protein
MVTIRVSISALSSGASAEEAREMADEVGVLLVEYL